MNSKIYLTTFIFFLLLCKDSLAQVVSFNDEVFKSALLAIEEINTNNDEEIQVSEAQSFTGKLSITESGISDLTGLGAFISMTEFVFYSSSIELDVSKNTALERLTCGNLSNLILGNNESLRCVFTDLNYFTDLVIDNSYLDTLICWHNNGPMNIDLSAATSLEYLNLNDNYMTSVDLSGAPNLKTLHCHVNLLTKLDISENLELEHLKCQLNPLEELDVSNNLKLKYLGCSATSILSLDLSQNPILETLIADFTQLTHLDLSTNSGLRWFDVYGSNLKVINLQNGNNSNFEYFDGRACDSLVCVQVDDVQYSIGNWSNIFDPNVFSENCDVGTNIEDPADISEFSFSIFPNPTSSELVIELDKIYQELHVEIYNSVGHKLDKLRFLSTSTLEINIGGEKGLYFLKITTDNKSVISSVVKE